MSGILVLAEDGGAVPSGSPEALEEDEAELELQKQLEKGRRLRQLQQLQQLRDSGEKVRLAAVTRACVASVPSSVSTFPWKALFVKCHVTTDLQI